MMKILYSSAAVQLILKKVFELFAFILILHVLN